MLKCKCGNTKSLMGFIQEDINEFKCRNCKEIIVDEDYSDVEFEYDYILDEVALTEEDDYDIEIEFED